MQIEDILKKIGVIPESRNSNLNFETFVLHLLKIHQKKSNRPFEIEKKQFPRDQYDAFAPEGIEELTGPTIIEIKHIKNRLHIKNIINRFLLDNLAFRQTFLKPPQNYLIIIPLKTSDIKEIFPSSYIYDSESENGSLNIQVWGLDEINRIVSKNKRETREIIDKLFSLRIETAVIQESKDWKKEREDRIEEISRVYEKGRFSLFLGAGVSRSAGMPDWNTLLNSLFVTYLTNEFDNESKINDRDISQIVKRLNQIDEKSTLMAARYLRKGFDKSLGESVDFAKAITKNLYALRNSEKPIDSDLLKAIVELCTPLRTGAKVKSVVTYNFDDLIERQLKSLSIQHNSIYTDGDSFDPEELPIYHVHGFLPEDNDIYKFIEKSTLVFSEEGYHHIYSNPYHWSNLVQLSNLRDNHCLLVGLSLNDPNLRRLLDIASRNTDKTKHFAFMKRITIDKFAFDEQEKIIDNEIGAKKFLDRHHNLNEEIMRELGVSIIWYTKYAEIPNLLRNIKCRKNS